MSVYRYRLIAVIVICLTILSVSLAVLSTIRVKIYVENGYVLQMMPGHPCPVWTKPYDVAVERKLMKSQ